MTKERCRQLRLGQITPSSTADFLEYKNYQSIETSNKIALVHAYADGPYDRSSFHLAGNADLVADVASHVAIDAIDGLNSSEHMLNNDHSEAASAHPYVGLVDHISVMPLSIQNEILVEQASGSITSTSQNGTSQNDGTFSPPDAHGLCSVFIGKQLSQKGIEVFYYGSAHPNQIPLATVRREKTHFFRSGGLDVNSSENDTVHNICTVGSPPLFVENYNILMSRNVNKKKAISLAKKIRERDGGITGVEALTLPYSQGRYEVACNLLRPNEGSVDDILHTLQKWVQNEQQDLKCIKSGGQGYFIDNSYRVGTTVQQCIDALDKCEQDKISLLDNHDSAVIAKFHEYLLNT